MSASSMTAGLPARTARRCLLAIVVLACLPFCRTVLAQQAGGTQRGSRPPIALLNLDRSMEGALLESRLRREDDLRWWPRRKTQELVRSIAVSTRLDLPILEDDADVGAAALPVLVIVASVARGDQRFVQMTVCDAETGLRLGVERVAVDSVADIDALARTVKQSLQRRSRWSEVWAVPPLVSRDLGREFDADALRYAEEIEGVLLSRPEAVLVEFDFAGAIDVARRAAGRVAPIERPAPVYLLGEYRNDGSGEKRRVTLSLRAIRGQRQERDLESDSLTPKAAIEQVRQFAGDCAKYLNGAPLVMDQPGREQQLLAQRWGELRRSGGWAGAWRVSEAHLLLSPDQWALRSEALTALSRIISDHWSKYREWSQSVIETREQDGRTVQTSRPNPRRAAATDHALLAINGCRRGFQHVDLLHAADDPQKVQLFRDPTSSFLRIRLVVPTSAAAPGTADWRIAAMAAALQDEAQGAQARRYYEAARIGRLMSPEFIDGQMGPDAIHDALRALLETQHLPEADNRNRLVIDRVTGQSGGQGEAERIVEQLVKSGEPAIAALAADARARLERLAAARAAASRPAPSEVKPQPEVEPAEPADIEFDEIDLPWKRLRGVGRPVQYGACQLCLAAGGVDLFYGDGQLLLMKKRGEAVTLWEDDWQWFARPSAGPPWACYDGRYAWIPLVRTGFPQRLLMVDPREEKVIEWSSEDGLPFAADGRGPQGQASLAVTALRPGKICVAGSSERGWLAIAEYDPEKGKSARVFFEARDEPTTSYDAQEVHKSTLAFRPTYIFTLSGRLEGQQPSQRIVIGRASVNQRASDYPLLVDPDAGTVQVIPHPLKSFILPYATPHGDTLYWATSEYVYDRDLQRQKRDTSVFRLGYPDFQPHLVVNHGEIGGSPMMKMGFDDAGMHCVADPWFTTAAPDQPLRRLRGKLPQAGNAVDRWLLAPSSIYRWLIYSPRHGRVFAVRFKDTEGDMPEVKDKMQ